MWDGWPISRILFLFTGLALLMITVQVSIFHYRQNFRHWAQYVPVIGAIAKHILYDERKELLDYVLHHMDNKLSSPIGEDQRKVGTPEQKVLIRQGLKALNRLAQKQYGAHFLDIDPQQQLLLLSALDSGKAAPMTEWQTIPQKELFKKLTTQITSAYYSHPTVWSEIGYGGPAYPRGYVRVERGLTDPCITFSPRLQWWGKFCPMSTTELP